ncbi:HAD family hydrolase [Candidatus Methylacidiphilum infernorum]|uniref:HAD superfamily hydrolase n=1 Tax=Methylacidiphilum infernorum (isolate V4) TaxID=481448 RepID=B3DYS2_METI4|nr:HAD family hydrolase [Candidatus Methylacidiphilum infernorum]ACD82444.1 HAD superfamily hydrolase [Methylacidiphilum infernorum V4]
MSFFLKHKAKKKRPAIFFDLVGTLLDVAQPVGEVYCGILNEFGIESDPRVLQKHFNEVFNATKIRPKGTIPKDGQDKDFWMKLVRTVLEKSGINTDSFSFASYFEKLYSYYARKEAWLPYPEVFNALQRISELQFPLFVASNWDNRAKTVLRQWGMAHFFAGIYLSAELGVSKPMALFYESILLRTNSYWESLFFVEDDPQMQPPFYPGIYVYLLKRPEKNLFDFLYQLQRYGID